MANRKNKKRNYNKTCERCGNDSYQRAGFWQCPYCRLWQGLREDYRDHHREKGEQK